MSSLPKQLQDQIDAAEQFYEKGESATPPANEAEGANSSSSEQSGSETQATVETPAVAPAQSIAPAEDENSETYAQRWRSLQGIHHSLTQKAGYLEQRVGQLEELISSMQSAPAPQAAPEEKKHLTDKDREDYGDDMVDFVKRAVAEGTATLQKENHALRSEIQRLNGVVPAVQQVVQQQHMNQEERFWNGLAQAVPDWESVNNNQGFKNWLLDADPMTGITRQTYLADAQQSLDVGRVANIFHSWKQQFGTTAPQQQNKGANKSTTSELEKQIAPGKTTAASAPQTEQAKTWSTGEIAKFYDDARKGQFKGRDEEMRALERDIFLAQQEGRVVRQAA